MSDSRVETCACSGVIIKPFCGHSIQVAADHATYTCTARISTVSACLIEQAAVNAPFDAEKRKVCRFLRLFLR